MDVPNDDPSSGLLTIYYVSRGGALFVKIYKLELSKRPESLAAIAVAGFLASGAPAYAVCTPAAADGVTATCTGTTINQNATNGYGTGNEFTLNTTVVQGATVTGTDRGIDFSGGSATNFGSITGGVAGIGTTILIGSGNSPTVTNFGTITGSSYGIFAANNVTVTNSGTITGGSYGIFAANNATVTNSGTIAGANSGVFAEFDGAVTNSGTIRGGDSGIMAIFGVAPVTNSGTITGGIYGIFADGAITNSGTIAGGNYGILADGDSTTVTNSGAITGGIAGITANVLAAMTNSGTIIGGSYGIISTNSATVTNSGAITGGIAGIALFDLSTVTNSGSITGGVAGIDIARSATVTNSGTIAGTGAAGIGIFVSSTGNVTNSGTIIGGSGTAIKFNASGTPGSDILTVLPGARFGGLVDFGGGADKVTFGPGSWILNTANFNALLSTVATPGIPYFVTPNQIVVADVSGFGAQNRAIMDITGWISSVLPDAPVFAAGAGGGSSAFAAVDTAASPSDAFTSFPQDALGYAATKVPVFKAASAVYADGNAVWAKGFGGQRQQDTTGTFTGGTTTGYGGAVGYERMLDPDLKIGALLGASTNRTNLYSNAGSTGTDTMFGGAYGRKTWGGTFFDLAVIGGNLDNTSARNIAGGLALQTATASYGGWFIDPSLMAGRRLDIDGRGFTVTPAVKVRYVAAHFDGYTETGSTANLTVAGRDFQAFEERAEITFANGTTLANGNPVTARVTAGILGQQRSTGGQVNLALLGQTFLAATPDRGSITGGYGGVGLDWRIGKVTLFAAGEATSTNDATRTYAAKGGVRVGW
jgi:outer membrane autotransporter protein